MSGRFLPGPKGGWSSAAVDVITLTSDFGTADGFAGAMKGVLASRAPAARLIDLSHEIEPFDRVGAYLLLRNAAPQFPRGTIHLVVVDPGVGTARRGLVVEAEGRYFVGPDNGILTALPSADERRVFQIDPARFLGSAATFHGRDVFAPIAAEVFSGTPPEALGTLIDDPQALDIPLASRVGNLVKGEIIHADRFGNLISNVSTRIFGEGERVAVSLNYKPVRFGRTFGEVEPGEPVAYWGSGGLLEIGLREGSAKALFGSRGLPIEVLRC